MEVYVKDLSKERFLQYAEQRKKRGMDDNKYHYSYMTKGRLEWMFDFYSKKKMKSSGAKQLVTINGEFSSQISSPVDPRETDTFEAHEANLFHELWCKCEWAGRIVDKETEFLSSVYSEYRKKKTEEFKSK